MSLVGRLHDVIRRVGYEVTPHPLARLLADHRPDVVIDVGANQGQFGLELRRRGFGGRIVSFEPHPDAFRRLERVTSGDDKWVARNEAVGDVEGTLGLHLGEKDYTSSLLAPAASLARYTDAPFVGTASVAVRRLDSVFEETCRPSERVALKVDTQGYERAVIEGAGKVLESIESILLEVSFVPLYEAEPPAEVVIAQLRERGFVPAYLTPAFTEAGSRRWLQADVLFLRERAS